MINITHVNWLLNGEAEAKSDEEPNSQPARQTSHNRRPATTDGTAEQTMDRELVGHPTNQTKRQPDREMDSGWG